MNQIERETRVREAFKAQTDSTYKIYARCDPTREVVEVDIDLGRVTIAVSVYAPHLIQRTRRFEIAYEAAEDDQLLKDMVTIAMIELRKHWKREGA